MNIFTKHEVVRAGDKIEIDIELKNTSKQVLTVGRDETKYRDFKVDVRSGTGQEPALTEDYDRRIHPKKREDLVLESDHAYFVEPGETIKESILINKMFDLNTPGQYTIQIHRFDLVSETDVKSNSISVTVSP